jgi:hypothetical protein
MLNSRKSISYKALKLRNAVKQEADKYYENWQNGLNFG